MNRADRRVRDLINPYSTAFASWWCHSARYWRGASENPSVASAISAVIRVICAASAPGAPGRAAAENVGIPLRIEGLRPSERQFAFLHGCRRELQSCKDVIPFQIRVIDQNFLDAAPGRKLPSGQRSPLPGCRGYRAGHSSGSG